MTTTSAAKTMDGKTTTPQEERKKAESDAAKAMASMRKK